MNCVRVAIGVKSGDNSRYAKAVKMSFKIMCLRWMKSLQKITTFYLFFCKVIYLCIYSFLINAEIRLKNTFVTFILKALTCKMLFEVVDQQRKKLMKLLRNVVCIYDGIAG